MESDLKTIPYVGERTIKSLNNMGITCVNDLKGKIPEEMYKKDCENKGFTEDRCALYLFRMAVYYAENKNPEEEKLKWWYWKDKDYPEK